ncbi:sensor histidine kinase [Aliikangiella coralliicola]|uniref:histidine kinase n=1 Tax=Aliikangiella coralliicola TaxID=2592383 RepID=A0A545UGF3_9GAMM|nr:ATP-binding protein [Aliikangiella coralliicola]TQV88556.1 hypothetical protein FLL46_08540 [Aliikangiella coralliicola]
MTNKRKSLEKQLAIAVCVALLPSTIIIFLLLFFGDYSFLLVITICLLVLLSGLIGMFYIYRNVNKHLLTLANLVEGIRNKDFSLRINLTNKAGSSQELSRELNLLAENLQQNQIDSVESSITLDKLIEQIDIPVVVIDERLAVQNSNHYAARLFNQKRRQIIGLSVEQLKIESFLKLPSGAIVEHHFPTQGGRWEIKSKILVSSGSKYRLLVISDISRALRLEERNAWSRMVRVIGHELNNSLTSISSLAETLLLQLDKKPADDQLGNLRKGLKMILEGGESLQRFISAYASIAKLPAPNFEGFFLHDFLDKVTALYPDEVKLEKHENIKLNGDQDQLQAAVINLIKNGIEAGEKDDKVVVSAKRKYEGVVIQVSDSGPGIANHDNLFVPFYTTKDNGSGIGLVLSREIAEAHKGSLNLYNRSSQDGCVAEIWLPENVQNFVSPG